MAFDSLIQLDSTTSILALYIFILMKFSIHRVKLTYRVKNVGESVCFECSKVPLGADQNETYTLQLVQTHKLARDVGRYTQHCAYIRVSQAILVVEHSQ